MFQTLGKFNPKHLHRPYILKVYDTPRHSFLLIPAFTRQDKTNKSWIQMNF